ncbi:MAG TPA: type 1 glutamine amidotransferase domain-containing protein [Candidatus Anoxymicrobiaceae bacterium]
MALKDKKVLFLLGPQYQDEEGRKPYEFLLDNGARVDVAGLEKGMLKGLHGRASIEVTRTIDEVDPLEYDALVIPGGRGPANLRKHPEAVELVRSFFETGKTVAAICHGPQMLAAADLLKGKTITGYKKIKKEMLDAGADFVDQPVAIDANLITSRDPGDIPQFDAAIEKALT